MSKTIPEKFEKMLKSYINGNRNDHRIDFWMMEQAEKMAYLDYCLESMTKEDYKKLLYNLRYPMKDEY